MPERHFASDSIRASDVVGPSVMFESDSPEGLCTGTALADIVNTAIRVGRGTETLATLATKLKPYGLRRKV